MEQRKKNIEALLLVLIFISILGMVWNFFQREYNYTRYKTNGIEYVKAKVVEIYDQELTLSGTDNEYMTGYQQVEVELENGETVGIDHYVTLTHNVVLKEGTRVIVLVDRPEGIEPYYSIFNYDRGMTVWIICGIFFLILLVVAGKNGLRGGLGLGFTLAVVVCYMLPELYEGGNSFRIIIISIIVSSVVSCFCIGGFGKKTLCNTVNTTIGCMTAGGIYYLLVIAMKMNGGTMETAEELQLISQETGMTLQGIMFAGIMIGVLGAVMDVAVSLGAALWEIREVKDAITKKEMFMAGMNIGKDMIGTMTNTLVLAFLGGTLPTLIILISYGVQYQQFISSDFLALELVQGIAGSIAVILMVPISAFSCSMIYSKK